MKLRHVTDGENVESIMREGVRPVSFWCDADMQDLIDYYIEEIAEEGGEAVVLEADVSAMDEAALESDSPSIAEPITMAIGKDEKEVIDAWHAADGTWQESLEIVGSLRCRGHVPASALKIAEDLRPPKP